MLNNEKNDAWIPLMCFGVRFLVEDVGAQGKTPPPTSSHQPT